jgi:hypothetical protein
MIKDPGSGLMLPRQFVDEKVALKKVIDDLVDNTVNSLSHVRENYFLTLHAKFDPVMHDEFKISEPKVTYKIPPFMSNTFVFWVSPIRGICELLWIVPPKKPGEKKLHVEFNKEGVAYLQAKGAMPTNTA